MKMSMDVNYLEIREWLVNILGENGIPKYEVNDDTTLILHAIMKNNQQREKNMQRLIEDVKFLTQQIDQEGKKLKELLQKLEIGPTSYPAEIQSLLYVLVYSSMNLELPSPSEINFLFGLNHLKEETSHLEEENVSQDKLLTMLKINTKETMQRKNKLEKILEKTLIHSDKMEREVNKHCTKNRITKEKIDEYKRMAEKLELQYSKINVPNELHHDILKEKYENILKIKKSLDVMQKKLDGYFSLPPDVEITKAKIKQAQSELASLQAKVMAQIDMLYM